MRSALGVVAVLLVFNLALSAPLSTVDAAHRDQLVDWVFPHLHPNGHVDAALATPPTSQPFSGSAQPTLGAASGLDSGALGLGLTPPLPFTSPVRLAPTGWDKLAPDSRQPTGWSEQPPDPPPTA